MRDTLIHIARDLFTARGIAEVSLDEIAAIAGITARHLRAYFTSTQALAEAALPAGRPGREGAGHVRAEGHAAA